MSTRSDSLKISIVIPVYNAEKYLDQAIQSVINQDVGLGSIELVLVNDGSRDGSGAICEKYASAHPESIVYVSQKNAGVSEARNTGIENSTGDYIGFLDADDYLSLSTIGAVIEYFKSAPKDVDVAITRVIQFGHRVAERSINRKFDSGTRTLDLNSPEWSDVYPRVAPSFIRSEVAKRHKFHKEIGIYEDTRYIGEVLAENMKMGVVSSGVYYNRIHPGDSVGASITTGAAKDKRLYLDSPKSVSLHLLKGQKGKGKLPPVYFQYMALYEMRWRVFYNPYDPRDILTKDEYVEYEDMNRSILKLVSDEAIIGFELYSVNQRIALLSMKHGVDVLGEATIDVDTNLVWNGYVLVNYRESMSVRLDDVLLSGDEISVIGHLSLPTPNDTKVLMRLDGEHATQHIRFEGAQIADQTSILLGVEVVVGDSFKANIPVGDLHTQRVDFALVVGDSEHTIPSLRLVNRLRRSFNFNGHYTADTKMGGVIIHPLTSYLTARMIIAKGEYLLELMKRVLRKVKSICIRMIRMLK